MSKDRLPILYLWVAYYGWRMNNFRQACSRLGIDPRSAAEFEAAKLVARLKYPEPRDFDVERLKKIHRRAIHLIELVNRTNEYPYTHLRGKKWNHSKFQSRSKV